MDTQLRDISDMFQVREAGLAFSQAVTDPMVERLVTTCAHGIEVLDRLNDDETRAAVHHLLDGVTAMHKSGSLDAIVEVAQTMQAARAAMTDQMIERLYVFMETMVTSLATQDVAKLAQDAELSIHDAVDYCESPHAPTGLWGVIRSLSKPETIQTLNLMVAFGNCLRERTKRFDGRLDPESAPEEG